MKTYDYIIVGCGLAGIAFCEQLRTHNKSFLVFDNNSQQASSVAGGLYNPVILKRFSYVWKSKEQLELALAMYADIEARLQVKLDYKLPVYRRFTSVEEQNDWFTASDKALLAPYLSTNLHKNNNASINAKFGFGEVLQTGRIDTKVLIETYKEALRQAGQLVEEAFDYNKIQTNSSGLTYAEYQAKHLVFAEGYGMSKNPYFKDLPLNEVKGELITIHAPELKWEVVLKASVFIIPMGKDLYRVGATYDWDDKTNTITAEARETLLEKLKPLLKCEFEVVDQVAGIRPTVNDRRPLVGAHLDHENIYILNGLGTRGVMIGPYVAHALYAFISENQPLDPEIDIKRFYYYDKNLILK